MFPELSDRIVTFLCHDDGAIPVTWPDQIAQILSIVPNDIVVRVREELIVENSVRKLETISLFFPQTDLNKMSKKMRTFMPPTQKLSS